MANAYQLSLRRIGAVVLLALFGMAILELALQVRSHVRHGQSIFSRASGETMYVKDKNTGLKLLRPSKRFEGSQATITSNSVGLRGPDLIPDRPAGSVRVALIGASSVMGAYSKTNDVTLSALIRDKLSSELEPRTVEVVNAGIAGATLSDQHIMLTSIVAKMTPDVVILYSGFNDFGRYCRSDDKLNARRWQLPTIELPKFLLTVDLLLKNTDFLRSTQFTRSGRIDLDSLDYSIYVHELHELIAAARANGINLILATNARAYRPDQTVADQIRLSSNARYFNHCFSVADLHEIYDRHNNFLIDAATREGLELIRLDENIPGGDRYFADSNHFNEAGERMAAEMISSFILERGMLVAVRTER